MLTNNPQLRRFLGETPETIPNPPTFGYDRKMGDHVMEAEIRRLEDRIEAVNREGQLRLDATMARIEGKFDTLAEQNRQTQAALKDLRDGTRGIRASVINTAIASVLAIAATVFGGIALWGGGFSSGQADRPALSAPAATSTHQ